MAKNVAHAYLSRFPHFTPNPNATLLNEFERLAVSRGWRRNSRIYRKERIEYLLAEYDIYLGSLGTEDQLERLQAVCGDLGIEGRLNSPKKCKKALKSVHVNLIDLIDHLRGHERPVPFPSQAALREYTLREQKFFPLGKAKADSLLKVLLRSMF